VSANVNQEGAKVPALPADPLVVGVDFGTLSGRAVVVRVRDGVELEPRCRSTGTE